MHLQAQQRLQGEGCVLDINVAFLVLSLLLLDELLNLMTLSEIMALGPMDLAVESFRVLFYHYFSL